MRRLSVIGLAIAAATLPVAAICAVAPAIPAYVAKAVADPRRPAGDVASDVNRKPAETLAFAGVKPGMTVGEFYPGAGYFTRMLSDIVGPTGYVYGLDNQSWDNAASLSTALSAGHYTNVTAGEAPFGTVRFAKPLDMAWITQNYHDLKIAKFGAVDTLAFDRQVFAALKPGGIFFILDHEGAANLTAADIAKLHRIAKTQVIREVTAAGFKLVAEGNFLHRASDDHTLPIFDKRVEGKTDQYALKFVKPLR